MVKEKRGVMMKKVLLCAVLVLMAATSWAWQGKVVGVADGDTITVLRDGHDQYKIRLYGIDAPESSQPHGKASKSNLSELVFGKIVDVDPTDTDKYGRTVARISVDGTNVNAEQLRDGYAWLYRQYCDDPMCSEWAGLEAQAKASRVGLWSDKEPMAPWEWRHGGKTSASKGSGPITVAAGDGPYHGNTKSGVFHRPGCQQFNCKNCVAVFAAREEAVAGGYRPCGACKP